MVKRYILTIFDTSSLIIFISANFIILITPGPAILYTISRTIEHGRIAGLLSVYGLAVGTFPHALAVAFGFASVLVSSVVVFSILKYLGATYLIYLGISTLRRHKTTSLDGVGKLRGGRVSFINSFLVGVLNPKAILFFLAFLPQFIDPFRSNVIVQTLGLWLISQIMAVLVGSGYALVVSWFRGWFIKQSKQFRTGYYLAGGIYIGLGIFAAISGSTGK